MEKLCPVLALYTVSDWQEGCQKCIQLLSLAALGHTLGIHAEDLSVIEAFGLEKPASRIVVNTGTTFGGIGATTGILPSMTLGCGTFGNNITSDNIGPQHLLNIKRVAFGIKEMPVPKESVAMISDPYSSRAKWRKVWIRRISSALRARKLRRSSERCLPKCNCLNPRRRFKWQENWPL